MENDGLAARRVGAIAEDTCFTKDRLRDEFRMKPAPRAVILTTMSGHATK